MQRQVWLIPIADERVGVHFAGKTVKSLENTRHYLSASAVVIHYEEALYQVYGPLPLPFCKDGNAATRHVSCQALLSCRKELQLGDFDVTL